MSTIIATTFSNGSVSVPTATVVNGSAKAWASYSNTATATIDNSLNVSSITDNGVGDATFGFSTSFSSAAYASPVDNHGNAVGNSNAYIGSTRSNTKSASTVRCVSVYDPGTVTGNDGDNQSFVCMGDLA